MSTTKLSRKQLTVALSVSGVGLLALTALTRPSRIGPFGVLVWFSLLYAVLVFALALLKSISSKKAIPISMLFQIMIVALLALAIIALRSLDQLHARDLLLFGALLAIGIFYFRQRTSG
jgi:hypothetical protein